MNYKAIVAVLLSTAATSLIAVPTQCSDLDKASGWNANKKYTFSDGTITSDSGNFLVAAGKPVFKEVTIKAKITVNKATSPNWKTTGLAIYQDGKNFWKLSLAGFPDNFKNNPKGHFLELRCMKNGKWGSNEGIKNLKAKHFKWEFEKTYVVELKLTSDSITGTYSDEAGKVLGMIAYKLGTEAFKSGTPALFTGGFETKFSDVSVEGEK